MKKSDIRNSFLTLAALFWGLSSPAQDGHYWTQQYGTRSMLLSNSVIGGVEDLGAVYYNPARLGLIENPAFLLSAQVYEWNRFRVEDAFGESANISKSKFGGVPSLVAGTFKVGFLENHRFAYSVLQRQQINMDIDYRNEVFDDVLEAIPGEEYFGAYIRLNQKVKEEWASLGWSYPINNRFSVGLTTSVMIFNQDKGNQFELQALDGTGQVAIYRFNRTFGLNKYGILWKLGLAGSVGNSLWGLTVNTPVINVFGEGNYQYEEFFSGIPGEIEKEDEYITSKQDGLPAKLRSPWAVGVGFTFPVLKSKLHLSSEWYSGIPEYTLLEAREHYSQSNGDTINFKLIDDLNSVLNFGIGTELYLNEKMSFFLSFSTDFAAVSSNITGFSENKPVASNTVFSADYFHYAGGFMFDFPGADITLGFARTGGKQNVARPIDFPDGEDDGIFDRAEMANLKWERWRLVFSFSVPFLKDYVNRLQSKAKKPKE